MPSLTLGIVSDIHAENWTNRPMTMHMRHRIQDALHPADLILFAGDIGSYSSAVYIAQDFFPYTPVCVVAGNHEFDGGEVYNTLDALGSAAKATKTVHFLHRSTFSSTIKQIPVRVIGATLWTDFKLFNTQHLSMAQAHMYMPDYSVIEIAEQDSARLLTPQDTLAWHLLDRAYIEDQIAIPFDGMTIVLTHHAPMADGVHPHFKHDALSPAFASNLEQSFIRDDVDVLAWGHTHHVVNTSTQKTRLISAPVGYLKNPYTDGGETGCYGTLLTIER